MIRKSVLSLSLLSLIVCLAGCATAGKELDVNKLSGIQKGITTEREVQGLFGVPQMKSLNSEGKIIMLYHFTKVKSNAANFVPVAGLLVGGMDMRVQTLSVLVDKEGKVENYTLNDSQTDINSGLLNT